MDSKKVKPKQGPERIIQDAIIRKLTLLKWYVKETHGNIYQYGFPDLYCCNRKYGARWVEVKDPNRRGNIFTPAQLETFPRFVAEGVGVWVLTSDADSEIAKLAKACNWYQYLNYNC